MQTLLSWFRSIGRRKLILCLVVLSVCVGLEIRLEAYQSSPAQTVQSKDLTVKTDASSWSDDFDDVSGLESWDDVQISEGQLILANGTLLGVATSEPVSPTVPVQSWGRLNFTATVPLSTGLTVDVLDMADTPVMHNVPNGGSLGGIDAEMYPQLKLRATLSSTVVGQTPRLDKWQLTWSPEYPNQTYLPLVGNAFHMPEPPPPLRGAVIGFTGANAESPPGKMVYFPSVRKNDVGWSSSFAVQNITTFATTLTLEFFRHDGSIVYTASGISLSPYGTYIASLGHISSLADGSYALAVTATEPIVGMVNTLNAAGTMAVAYNGAGEGGQRIIVPRVFKDHLGWTSRLCIHNLTTATAQVTITYYDQDSSTEASRRLDLSGNGVNCIDLEQEPLLPPSFLGAAAIETDQTDLVVTVEDVESQADKAWGYLGFNLSAGSDILYIPRCRKNDYWRTGVIATAVGLAATESLTVNYYNYDGTLVYSYTYPFLPDSLGSGFFCPGDPPGVIVPEPIPPTNSLGSAVTSANRGELIALVTEIHDSSTGDTFSYPAPSVLSTLAYLPNVGAGLDNWRSTLSIQNPNPVPNTITVSFYNRTGEVLYEHLEDLSPNQMRQYDILQFGLSTAYEGSAVISATSPVAVLVSKQR